MTGTPRGLTVSLFVLHIYDFIYCLLGLIVGGYVDGCLND